MGPKVNIPILNKTALVCLECGEHLSLKKLSRTVRLHFERRHPYPEHPAAEILRGKRSALLQSWLKLKSIQPKGSIG